MASDKSERDKGKKKAKENAATAASEGREQMENPPFEVTPRRSLSRTEEEHPPPLWLITFTDIMALMLTFFVLLFAMSKPDEHKWEELSTAINQGFSKFYSPERYEGAQDTVTIDKLDPSRALDLDYLKALVEKLKSEEERLADVLVIPLGDSLLISLPSELLFEAGRAEVKEDGQRALFVLGGLLTNIRNRLEVLGHADPRPVTGGAYESNWDLSLARAASVGGVLRSIGYRRPVTVRGLSSGRYEELAGQDDESSRLDLSRRVDLMVLKDDGGSRGFLSLGE